MLKFRKLFHHILKRKYGIPKLLVVGLIIFFISLTNILQAQDTIKTSFNVNSQQDTTSVRGSVLDSQGPIIGATVQVKGTNNITITNEEGAYVLKGIKKGDVIQVSYIGYATQENVYNKEGIINFMLQEDSQVIDELVVVGFGSQKKVHLTGSVSVVNSKAIESRPVVNVGQALQGVVPGLNFSVNNGGGTLDNSLNVNIRGTGSIGSGSNASPLVLIDGMEGNMNAINPSDIESISVLKDAASAAVYGARGSFGVILITTKKGKEGRATISYSGNVRFTSALAIPEMMDSYTFAKYFNAAAKNNGQEAVFSEAVMKRIKDYQNGVIDYGTVDMSKDKKWDAYTESNGNTNWFKEMYKSWVPSYEHSLSIDGGTEKIIYRVSGSFLNENGLIRYGKDKLSRYTIDAKISAKLTDWVKINYTSKWTREDYKRPTYMTALFFHNISRRWPTCPVYDPNGYLLEGMETIQMRDGGVQKRSQNYYTQQLSAVFEPVKNWKINLEGNIRSYFNKEHLEILPIYAHDTDGKPYAISWDDGADYSPGASRVKESRYSDDYITTNIYSDYTTTFSNHTLTVLAGFNAELTITDSVFGSGDMLISPSTPYLQQTQDKHLINGGRDHNSLAGLFGRINYNFKEKYLLDISARYDGASRFIGDKRWGFFPSLSAGWVISNENFFAGIKDKINFLKIRGSIGQLGNNRTKNWYPFYLNMGTGAKNSSWLIDGKKQNTSWMPGLVNNQLTWETIETWDVGLDWGMFSNRFSGSFAYFNRYTYNMVGPAPSLPSVLGTDPSKINNCDLKSYGWELEMSWRDVVGDFDYGVKLVLSDCQEVILKYPNATKNLDNHYNGKKLGEIWGLTTVGIAQSQEEMNNHIKNNKPTWGSNWTAGDIMYKDINGDKEVNKGSWTYDDHGDYSIIGNSTPRYNFGLSLDFKYKGVNLSMFWQGIAKRDYWLDGAYFWGTTSGQWQSAGFKEHWDFWRPENDPNGENKNAYYPRPSFGGEKNQYVQTRYLQDASYIRLKNIQLGYSFPKNLISKIGLSNAKIYVSVDNAFTISKVTGIFDPETLGGEWGPGKLYPLSRVVSFGTNINF